MDFSHIKTVQSCEENIISFQNSGYSIPQELLDRLEELKAAEKAAAEKLQNEGIYEHFARTVGYSDELKKCIEITVDKLMEDGPNAKKPGLLLGKIQSGKTRAFVGVIGLAFDRGFDACVVLTKGTKPLLKQTVQRLREDFHDYLDLSNLTNRCVVNVSDIGMLDTGLSDSQLNDQKNIIVCMKEHTNVKRLIRLISKDSPGLASKKILIIDDEADFVSVSFSTKRNDTKQGEVSRLIDKFLDKPAYCRYLQVTATPYSLYLQPDFTVKVSNGKVKPFRPRFTTLVPIHNQYIGGKQYFVESKNTNSMYSHLYHTMSNDCLDRLLDSYRDKRLCDNVTTTGFYNDLRWAMMSYFIASAIRKIQVQKSYNKNYLTSFLMHVSTQAKDHKWQNTILKSLLGKWGQNMSLVEPLFETVFEDLEESVNKGIQEGLVSEAMPCKSEVWERVKDLMENKKYCIHLVNSQGSVPNMLDDKGQLLLNHDLNIFVGGFILDRGITIDHVLGFVYGRRPSTEQQDTVLQHCRMYGNRSKEDMSVTRLHTTARLYDNLERIDRMDEQLRDWFLDYQSSHNDEDPSAVFLHLSDKKEIIPCSKQKLVISSVTTLKPFKRITTYGFQTDCASKIKGTIDSLDALIESQPNYKKDDVFEIDTDVVINILKKIRSTFIYSRPKDRNADYEWNEDEMIGCIQYATKNTGGKMLCLHRTGRNMSRVRANGNFVDAPEDGNTDTPLARANAITMPVIMLLKQEGLESQGWRDTPFYWPSLTLPSNLAPAIFSTMIDNQ